MMLSIFENRCPQCQSTNNSMVVNERVMECSGQRFRICNNCSNHFVDTFLLDHYDKNEVNRYKQEIKYELHNFALEFDSANPNSPADYYQNLNTYLFDNEGSLFIRDYIFAEDVLSADEGILTIINLNTKQVLNNGLWIDLEINNNKLGDLE